MVFLNVIWTLIWTPIFADSDLLNDKYFWTGFSERDLNNLEREQAW